MSIFKVLCLTKCRCCQTLQLNRISVIFKNEDDMITVVVLYVMFHFLYFQLGLGGIPVDTGFFS